MGKVNFKRIVFVFLIGLLSNSLINFPTYGMMEDKESSSTTTSVKRTASGRDAEEVSRPTKKMRFTVNSPLYDTIFKRVFGQDLCMITLLNSLYDFQGDDRISDVTYLSQEFPGMVDRAKSFIFDLRCRTKAGNIFIVEMQKKHIQGMTQRLELYSAGALIHQWNTYSSNLISGSKEAAHNNRYGGLQPVYTLAFLDYDDPFLKELRESGKFIHNYEIRHTEMQRNDFPLQHWTLVDLAGVRNVLEQNEEVPNLPENFRLWGKFLTVEDQSEVEIDDKYDESLKMAYIAASSLTADDRAILDQEKHELAKVEALFADAETKGMEKGLEKGIEEGIKKGMEKGEVKGARKALLDLLQQGITLPDETLMKEFGTKDSTKILQQTTEK